MLEWGWLPAGLSVTEAFCKGYGLGELKGDPERRRGYRLGRICSSGWAMGPEHSWGGFLRLELSENQKIGETTLSSPCDTDGVTEARGDRNCPGPSSRQALSTPLPPLCQL